MTQAEERRSCSARVTLKNREGLHARPAHLFVQTANAYASDLFVRREGADEPLDGKSILSVMQLCAGHGDVLELTSEGPDCDQQIRAIVELVDAHFGEE